jgi:glucose-6-phosphate isomerase
MLGWLELPDRIKEEEIEKIKKAAEKIRMKSDVLVVIGVGGSYLGARAVIEIFSHSFYNLQLDTKRKGPQIIYAGNNLSGKYLRDLIEYLDDKEVSINVISKSGTTLEPAIAFRILKLFMEEKYGVGGAAERIYVTTDAEKGILKEIADKEEYETFVIPRDVGGRYSVLSPVGLLPIAVAGIDFEEILDGAMFAKRAYGMRRLDNNSCYMYAVARNILYNKGKDIEILSSFEPCMQYFIEWYKQLFGESEGKSLKGIFPSGANYTTDLHSMGQLIQDGKRNIFETVINVENSNSFIKIPKIEEAMDGLQFIEGKEIDYINKKAAEGVYMAHIEGGVPTICIDLKEITEYNIGQLIFFFEKACAISGYILGVNPFDQPGVEAYKQNMFKLLGKTDQE